MEEKKKRNEEGTAGNKAAGFSTGQPKHMANINWFLDLGGGRDCFVSKVLSIRQLKVDLEVARAARPCSEIGLAFRATLGLVIAVPFSYRTRWSPGGPRHTSKEALLFHEL